MLKKAEGGDPIIDGKIERVKDGEVWVCIAGIHYHATTEVTGNSPRVMISFGHIIKNEKLKELKWI
jgi:hypothetical protein